MAALYLNYAKCNKLGAGGQTLHAHLCLEATELTLLRTDQINPSQKWVRLLEVHKYFFIRWLAGGGDWWIVPFYHTWKRGAIPTTLYVHEFLSIDSVN